MNILATWYASSRTLWTSSHFKVRLFTIVQHFIYSNSYLYHGKGKIHLTKSDNLVKLITKCFNCTHLEAEEFCTKLSQNKKIDLEIAEDHLQFLKNAGIDSYSLFNNPWLVYQSSKTINDRISLLKGIGLEVNSDTIPLIKLSDAKLVKATKQWNLDEQFLKDTGCENRLVFFASRLQRVLDSMLQHSIQPEDILKDLWIFRHNEDIIMERLRRAAVVGLHPVKTWMLRCPESVFNKCLQKWHNAKDVLGAHEDDVSYLAERLQCDTQFVRHLSRRYPQLLTINLPKVKQVLDFLFCEGYTPSSVCRAPRVLSHSVTTLQRRLEELNKLGYKPNNLRVLFTTTKNYERLKHELGKAQKK